MRDEAATREPPPRQLFVVVERGDAAMRMRLAPSDRGERFAVANGKVGIVAIEFLGVADRGSLTEVYHEFRNLDLRGENLSSRDRLRQAFSDWQTALARTGIALRLQREALYGPPLPRRVWSADAGGVSLRPWDIELTALEASLRRMVKLDQVPEKVVAALKEPCEKRGFEVEVVSAPDAGGGSTLLVSADGNALAEARDLERRLLVRGGDPSAGGAAARIGELLGYPSCCVERFQRVAEHNDTTLAWALLPASPVPASPFSQWLQPGLALLSHSPCDLNCAASIALARRLLDAVDAKDAGFATRWHSLATRVQVVDHEGNRLALAVGEGNLDSPQRVAASDLLSVGESALAAQPAALSGRHVVIECGGLATPEGDWYAPYVADHRSPGGIQLAAHDATD